MTSRYCKVGLALGSLMLPIPSPSFAAQSPVTMALEISQIYDSSALGAVFVFFKPNPANAMPGCYGDGAGFLFRSNSNFQSIYSILMTQIANKRPITGYVLYTATGEPQSSWAACNIDGLYLTP